MVPLDLTILCDNREKKPVQFPAMLRVYENPRASTAKLYRIKTVPCRLDTADYVLESHPNVGGVERKGGLVELAENFFSDDSIRFGAALKRLVDEFKYPAIYIEGQPKELLRQNTRPVAKPGTVYDHLISLLLEHNIRTLWGYGHSMAAKLDGGEIIARYLIQAALMHEKAAGDPQ